MNIPGKNITHKDFFFFCKKWYMNIKLFLIDVLKSTAEEVKGIKGKLLRDVDGLDNALKNLMSGGKIDLSSLSFSLLFLWIN